MEWDGFYTHPLELTRFRAQPIAVDVGATRQSATDHGERAFDQKGSS